MNLRIIVFLGIALSLGCASAPAATDMGAYKPESEKSEPPCWLRNPCPPYRTGNYLIGVGGGAGKLEADDAARADLAKVLKVKIHENLQMVEKSYTSHGVYGVQSLYSESVSREVRSETDLEIAGVKIVRRYQDGAAHHSLAVLERASALTRLDADLEELNQQSEDLVESSVVGDAIEGLRNIAKAAAISREYAKLNAQRAIIHGGGQGRPQTYGPEHLSGRLESLLRGIGITVNVFGEHAGSLSDVISEELTSAGFELVPESKARLAVKGDFQVEVGEPDGYGFRKVRTALVIRLEDAPDYGERTYRVIEYSAEASSRKELKALNITRNDIEQALRKPSKNQEGRVFGSEVVQALLGDENSGEGE